MVHVRFNKRMLWALLAAVALPALWVLEIELTYENNIHNGIPADFSIQRPRIVQMWKA